MDDDKVEIDFRLSGMVQFYKNWVHGPSSRFADLTHALICGASAAEIASASPSRDNPYERGSDWRWAWYTGFDLGRRIGSLTRQRNALARIIEALDPYIPPDAMVQMDDLAALMTVHDELGVAK